MNFDSLKDQIRDRLVEIWGRIQETSVYMSLREKFEALSARAQKGIIAGGVILGAIFLLSFPYSYISSSQDNMSGFEDNRELIRDLLKAAKTLKEGSPLPPGMASEELGQMVTRSLDEFHLVAEQNGGATPIADKITNLVPEAIKQSGVTLLLKKLNLRQIVEISHKLGTLGPGIKLMGLDVRENTTVSHYFDATFKIADFSVPMVATPAGKGEKGEKGKSAKAKAGEEDESEGGGE